MPIGRLDSDNGPETRPMRPVVLCLLLLMAFSPVLAQRPDRSRNSAPEPRPNRAGALPRASPERHGISSTALLAFVEAADREIDQMHSFMLVRHGHVIAEGWWAPYDAETPHQLFSLSKSFASTGVGLAVAEGKVSLDDEVLKFFPEEAPAEPSANMRSMRVRDLLRMATGHHTDPSLSRDPPGVAPATTWTKTFLAHPVPFKPGSHFLYNTPATYMCSAILQKATGMTLLDYLRPRLFEPLGFRNPTWPSSPQGITLGGYGLLARTEEIARFGQLYLRKGDWNGKRLLPAAWVEEATALQVANGSSPRSDWDQGYGYQFWRSRHRSYRGDGAFGQYCLVLPRQDAVVAITAGVRDMQAPMNLVWEKLLPAMNTDALPEDAAARRRLAEKLASLKVRLPAGEITTPLAAKISGRWYRFPENERGLQAVALDFGAEGPALVARTAAGETRTRIGVGAWTSGRGGFANGLERTRGLPERPLVAASGAWSAGDVFTLKVLLCETPFAATLTFRFDGDRLLLDSEQNVAFGPTRQPQLVGQAADAAQVTAPQGAIRLLVRADDMGVAQAVNEACIRAYRDGIARSVEVIVPGGWFLDAVRRLQENPGLDVGVHLTLTSEWERVKWGPLTLAPSLVDADGYFRPMTRQRADFPPGTGFLEANPNLEEVERELRAQIETARRHLGKRVSHLSAHMGTARATPALHALTRRLAKEYGLRLEEPGLRSGGRFGNNRSTAQEREQALLELVERLQPGQWLIVEHPGLDTPEMRTIGHKGYENVAEDRAAVTHAFTSPRVKEAVARRQIRLIGYADLTEG